MSSIIYVGKVIFVILLLNLVFTIVTFSWVTEDDITELPESGLERFISLFYSGVTIFASIGSGDLSPKSKRMRLYMSTYMIISFLFIKYYL